MINVFDRVNATCLQEYCEINMTINEDRSALSNVFDLKKNLTNLFVNYDLYVLPSNGEDRERRKVMGGSIDWCKLLRKSKSDYILKVMFRALNNKENHWLTKCPIEAVRNTVDSNRSRTKRCASFRTFTTSRSSPSTQKLFRRAFQE